MAPALDLVLVRRGRCTPRRRRWPSRCRRRSPRTHQPSRMRQVQAAVDADLHAAGAATLRAGGAGCSATRPRPAPGSGRRSCRSLRGTRPAGGTPAGGRCCTICGDQLLAAVVLRVGLAGEDELHRPVLVVRGSTPAARGCGRSGRRACRWRSGGRSRWSARPGRAPRRPRRSPTAATPRRFELRLQPAAGERDQPLAAALVRPPQLGVGDVLDPLPDGEVGRPLLPLDAEVAVVQLARSPGDSQLCVWTPLVMLRDRHLGDGQVGPDVLPHLPRHAAVQLADAVADVFDSWIASTVMQNGSLLVVGVLPAQAEERRCRSMPQLAACSRRSTARSCCDRERRRCRRAPACAW